MVLSTLEAILYIFTHKWSDREGWLAPWLIDSAQVQALYLGSCLSCSTSRPDTELLDYKHEAANMEDKIVFVVLKTFTGFKSEKMPKPKHPSEI